MRFGFTAPSLSSDQLAQLSEVRNKAAADCIRLVSLASSGHPGGSLSTLDALVVLYACGELDGNAPHAPNRDRVIVSHGHVSPAVYSTLAAFDFIKMEDAYNGFRRAGSIFGGHIESVVPGVEWNTGNLGQGLSAGAGFAMSARMHGRDTHVFVGMGDGEQQKGQIAEARRFAAKFGLGNLTAFIDVNRLQIGGKTDDIMPMDLAGQWAADGWDVVELDGHDHQALYAAFRACRTSEKPTVLLLDTIMGKGVSEIENLHKYHGQALSDEMADRAFAELGQPSNLDELRVVRAATDPHAEHNIVADRDITLSVGEPVTYGPDVVTDCRSAYGKALADLGDLNNGKEGHWPVVGISCDLEGSVKMNAFHANSPDHFIEAGIMEHNAAVVAGAMSKDGIVPFFSTFGMFALIESYNQQRLNDQNGAAPKVVVTHCGLDVGEDGPTHQCIDYVSALTNPFGFEVYCPADANECDRIIRTVATRYAPTVVAMGRSKMKTITARDGQPLLGGEHTFEPGVWPVLRPGDDAVIFAFGAMVYRAVEASDTLFAEGVNLRVVNASSLKPCDTEAILDAARNVGVLLTYEDHNADSGLGAIVARTVADAGIGVKLKRLGVTKYGTSGKPDGLFAEQGLAASDVVAAAKALVG